MSCRDTIIIIAAGRRIASSEAEIIKQYATVGWPYFTTYFEQIKNETVGSLVAELELHSDPGLVNPALQRLVVDPQTCTAARGAKYDLFLVSFNPNLPTSFTYVLALTGVPYNLTEGQYAAFIISGDVKARDVHFLMLGILHNVREKPAPVKAVFIAGFQHPASGAAKLHADIITSSMVDVHTTEILVQRPPVTGSTLLPDYAFQPQKLNNISQAVNLR